MKVKFAELLNQYGVTAEETTKKIAELKEDFDEAYSNYEDALSDLESIEDEGERQHRMSEINDFERDLMAADTELVKKIESWNKNKEVWAKGRAALAEKRAAKKSGAEPTATNDVVNAPISAIPIASGTATTSVYANGQPMGTLPANSGFEGDGGVVKKKSNAGWWILAGIVGIVTLGAVVMKKE